MKLMLTTFGTVQVSYKFNATRVSHAWSFVSPRRSASDYVYTRIDACRAVDTRVSVMCNNHNYYKWPCYANEITIIITKVVYANS